MEKQTIEIDGKVVFDRYGFDPQATVASYFEGRKVSETKFIQSIDIAVSSRKRGYRVIVVEVEE